MEIKASRGNKLICKGWHQEAALRMLQNNLDKEVAERPEDLVVYGGIGKAARNWDCYNIIVESLKNLENNETLLIQSGKAVGIIPTHEMAPRVLIVNSMIVPAWANWDHFRELEQQGLIMYGQMTAGSWIYIGTQGILQGTYETFLSCAKKYFNGDLTGKLVLTSGLGGMGGAQPLAITMNSGVVICVEVDQSRIEKRKQTGYLDISTNNFDEALKIARVNIDKKTPISIGLLGNASDIYPEFVKRKIIPDVVTDQTSAHDALNGYIPQGISVENAKILRKENPKFYEQKAYASIAIHVKAMLDLQNMGSHAFDYGNNIRAQAKKAGVTDAFNFKGFVVEYIRDLFCEGKGPFRWVALSGDVQDIYTLDEAMIEAFPLDKGLNHWIKQARQKIKFQGLPARICWLGYPDRARAGKIMNDLVAKGKLKAPIVIGRDHLDTGSVASPYRETEGMLDGSDTIADWPILNALTNAVNGASWVSVHHGGGVGIGYSIHAGQVCVADGTRDASIRIDRVLSGDPALGIIRHADAGYKKAINIAREKSIKIPGKK